MRVSNSQKSAKLIFAASAIYCLASVILGRRFSDDLFSASMPRVYSAMGILVFDHFSTALTTEKKAFSFVVLGSALIFAAGFIFRRGGIAKASSVLAKFYKLYFSAMLALITSAFFIAAVRIAPIFMLFTLAASALALRASSLSARLADDIADAKSIFRRTLIQSAFIAAAGAAVSGFTLGMAIFFAAFATLHLPALRMKQGRARRGPAASSYGMAALIFIMSFGAIGHFWIAPPHCKTAKLAAAGAKLAAASPYRPYDMLIAGNYLYIAYKEGAIASYDIRSDSPAGLEKVGFKGSTQRMIFNPETAELYSTLWRAENGAAVYVMRTTPRLAFERTLNIDNCPAIGLELDPATHQLLVLCEAGDKIVWFDYTTWQKTGQLALPRFTWPHVIKIDEQRRRVFVCSGSMSKYLYEIDADTKMITRKTHIGYVSLGMTYDPTTRLAYISKPFHGGVLVIDTSAMRTAGFIRTHPGVRDIDIDPARRLLYAGNYIDGTFQTISLADGKSLSEVFAGKQVRGVYHDCDSNRNYAASACGVFNIVK